MGLLKRATWSGPRREPPQPEKQYMAVAALTKAGLTVDDADDAIERHLTPERLRHEKISQARPESFGNPAEG